MTTTTREVTKECAVSELREAAQAVVALETTFSGAPKYGHVAEGVVSPDGYCTICLRAEPYDGWHERAAAILALRDALGCVGCL